MSLKLVIILCLILAPLTAHADAYKELDDLSLKETVKEVLVTEQVKSLLDELGKAQVIAHDASLKADDMSIKFFKTNSKVEELQYRISEILALGTPTIKKLKTAIDNQNKNISEMADIMVYQTSDGRCASIDMATSEQRGSFDKRDDRCRTRDWRLAHPYMIEKNKHAN